MKNNMGLAFLSILIFGGAVGLSASAERPAAILLNKQVERLIDQVSPAPWRTRAPHRSSLRELIEELYFEDTGYLLSAVRSDERTAIVKEYIGEPYDLLMEQMHKQFANAGELSGKIDVASFVAMEMLNNSLIDKIDVDYLELASLSRDEYLLALGFCGNSDMRDLLEEQVYYSRGKKLRFYAKVYAKKDLDDSGESDSNYNLYEIQEAVKRELDDPGREAAMTSERWDALRSVKALRYSGDNELGLVVALADRGHDPQFMLEVFKYAVANKQEERFAESILNEYSILSCGLNSEEVQLLRWVCLVVGKRAQAYRGNDKIIAALQSVAEHEGYWSEFASGSLMKLTAENYTE